MNNEAPDILFICGSPRSRTCLALTEVLETGAKKAGAKTQSFLLSKKRINPCVSCGACEKTGNCAFANKTYRGRFADDYLELKAVLERVDAVVIVAPVYFAGPPAQLKALYDRMQPYWAQRYVLGFPAAKKRPAQLFVVGSGEDSHGFAPLAGITKSAMAVAGFNLEKVNNFIGFKYPHDVRKLPSQLAADSYSRAELSHIRHDIDLQSGLVQRALDAGSAFARLVVKKKLEEAQASEIEGSVASPGRQTLERSVDAFSNEALASDDQAAKKDDHKAGAKDFWRQSSLEFKKEIQAEIEDKYNNFIARKASEDGETQQIDSEAQVDEPASELESASAPEAPATPKQG